MPAIAFRFIVGWRAIAAGDSSAFEGVAVRDRCAPSGYRQPGFAVDPAEVSVESAGHRHREQLRHLVRVELLERYFESVYARGPGLEHDHNLGFVGHLALPAIE